MKWLQVRSVLGKIMFTVTFGASFFLAIPLGIKSDGKKMHDGVAQGLVPTCKTQSLLKCEQKKEIEIV